jgi:hypothetical protein
MTADTTAQTPATFAMILATHAERISKAHRRTRLHRLSLDLAAVAAAVLEDLEPGSRLARIVAAEGALHLHEFPHDTRIGNALRVCLSHLNPGKEHQ